MKRLIGLMAFIFVNSTMAIPLSEGQKMQAAFKEASTTLQHDSFVLKSKVLNNALEALSEDAALEHETEVVLEIAEKKLPKKSSAELLSLLSSTLMSENK